MIIVRGTPSKLHVTLLEEVMGEHEQHVGTCGSSIRPGGELNGLWLAITFFFAE